MSSEQLTGSEIKLESHELADFYAVSHPAQGMGHGAGITVSGYEPPKKLADAEKMQLIEMVESRPLLWNPEDALYKVGARRKEEWTDIGLQLGLSGWFFRLCCEVASYVLTEM